MLSIFGFLAVLGPLVIFHEFGHYLFAKIFGVKAEIFSIGFGPQLISKKWGETTWCISLIPLGGYVKLLGDDPERVLSPEDAVRSLPSKAPWKRFFIFFGGPLFNFILAILAFMVVLLIGEPQLTAKIGRVLPGSYAAKVGLISGDEILSINSKSISKYSDLMEVIRESPDKKLNLILKRENPSGVSEEQLTVSPVARPGYSMYGEDKPVGDIDGMFPTARGTYIGVSSPNSKVGALGFKTGDRIASINGKNVKDWETLSKLFMSISVGEQVVLKIEKMESGKLGEFQFKKINDGPIERSDIGLYSSEMFIEKLVDDSPAQHSGLLPGDRIISLGGAKVPHFFALKDRVQAVGRSHGGRAIVEVERDGKILKFSMVPSETVVRDPMLKKKTQYTIGIYPKLIWAEPDTIVERVTNPFLLVYSAVERTFVFSWRNMVGIGKLLTGDVSVNSLGGPILIGKIAGESISRGLLSFLTTMAVISVGLGVLNLLPIPILDGGHLMLLGIEMVRGKPLSLRQMEITQQVGLALILLLTVLVMKNDLMRLTLFD